MCFIWVSTLIAGCVPDNAPRTGEISDQPLVLTADMRVSTEGILEYGGVFAENPTTLMEPGDFHGYEFDGRAGGVVTITMNANTCGVPDPVLHLFGPANAAGDRGANLAENDDALLPCFLDSQIKSFTLPINGTYLIVATSFLQQGGNRNYRLSLTCDNAACTLPGSLTFASSKVAQTSIDSGAVSADTLFDIGDFLFEYNYQTKDGMGNALTGLPANNTPRPNFRPLPNNVHFAAFGAPEAQSCVTCHNIRGYDLNHNIFQMGDGINRTSGLPRNPPALLGLGLRQRIGEEMTAELQGRLAAGKAQAAATGVNVTVALSSKGISFGSLVVNPDGTVNVAGVAANLDGSVNSTGVVGVDTDLVVKPFGWKGREATLRRFIEGSFRVHFGMQAEPSVNKHCITPNSNTLGTGSNCQDPDGDGVTKEITDGQLTAEAVYLGLRETPVRVPAANPATQTCANDGEALFKQIGCTSCHTQAMAINNPVHIEPADTTGGPGITLNLATQTRAPRPAVNANGSMAVELWSDFKRHNMGVALADSKPFNQIAADEFITPPLWGIADSAPYLHDGRAPTLNDAILWHAGEAELSRDAYVALSSDDQWRVLEFLGTLRQAEVSPTSPTCTVSRASPIPQSPVSPMSLDLSLTDDCPRDACGLNGVWLGDGVPFRTLHLDGSPNDQGLTMVDFQAYDKNPLTVDIERDSLIGRTKTGSSLTGSQLIGSCLTLQHPSGPPECQKNENIFLNIINFTLQDFLAECKSPDMCDNKKVPVYTFTATKGDGYPIEVCRPGLNGDDSRPPQPLRGCTDFSG
jgi:hypothetical protein